MRRLSILLAIFASFALAGGTTLAAPATGWKVYSFNASGQAYASKTATAANGFAFTAAPDAALFANKQDKSLLGDLTGKTLTATFTITGSTDAAFTYYGAPGACGLNGPNVRLYFEGNTTGKFTYDTAGYSKYWWSNPTATVLAVSSTSVTLAVPLTTANWSDWGGELASSVPTYFAAAIAQVSAVGLSFGGGCFFANGVGMSAGSATFTLTNYSVN